MIQFAFPVRISLLSSILAATLDLKHAMSATMLVMPPDMRCSCDHGVSDIKELLLLTTHATALDTFV